VIVDDFGLVRMTIPPNEVNPPLIVDSDRMLAAAAALQRFEPIARRNRKILNAPRTVEQR
jgi:hypothetical protein